VQQSEQPSPPARRRRAYVSILGTTQMHLRSPVIVALWSAIFPGLGHLLLSKYVSGVILFLWEVVINLKAHLNLSIFYTFTGNFEYAKAVLDKRWLLLYIPTYLFAIWDSYRSTVDMNNHFVLAAREDAEVQPFIAHPLSFNYVDKSSPWVAVFWSAITPGAGQLIIHRIFVAYFLLILWIIVVYMSNALPAIYHTALGQFDLAKNLANKQWMLNIPSILFFAIYDAYTNTVESNKLFEWEQSKYLKKEYQDRRFPMPFEAGQERARMYVVSNFEHSIKLESAVTELQIRGIPKQDILAVPLDKQDEDKLLFDRTHSSDGHSTLDFPIISAALFALFGIIYGFLFRWGPVLWALIGTGAGFALGLGIKLIISRKRRETLRAELPEVVLVVACDDRQLDQVKDALWKNGALGVGRLCLDDDA